MTRDEAKKIMENEVRCVRNPNCERLECRNCYLVMPEHTVLKAYDVAIKALEQQTCEDAVSRAEAMTEIMMFTGNVKTDEEDIYIKVSDAVQLLRELPPVKPQYTEDEIQKMQELEQAEIEKAYELGKAEQQRVGHWEKMVEVYDLQQNRMLVPYSYDDSKFGNTPVYVCDCGCESNKNSRFCPDCGAKMVELQESEVSE